MYSPEMQEHSIPLVVKKQGGSQKFRLPFKDFSNCTETEIDFSFIKLNSEEPSAIDCLEFFCMPANIKLMNSA